MKQDDKPWQTLSSNVAYQNLWMRVHEDKTKMPNAEGLQQGDQELGDFEAIRATKAVSLDQLMTMVYEGSFADGQSLAALMKYIVWRRNGA